MSFSVSSPPSERRQARADALAALVRMRDRINVIYDSHCLCCLISESNQYISFLGISMALDKVPINTVSYWILVFGIKCESCIMKNTLVIRGKIRHFFIDFGTDQNNTKITV